MSECLFCTSLLLFLDVFLFLCVCCHLSLFGCFHLSLFVVVQFLSLVVVIFSCFAFVIYLSLFVVTCFLFIFLICNLSFCHSPELKGAPQGFVFPISAVRVSAGAGFVYPMAGSILTMPGLSTRPGFLGIDLDEKDGSVRGLF
jgi:hypothetical protein